MWESQRIPGHRRKAGLDLDADADAVAGIPFWRQLQLPPIAIGVRLQLIKIALFVT